MKDGKAIGVTTNLDENLIKRIESVVCCFPIYLFLVPNLIKRIERFIGGGGGGGGGGGIS